MIPDFQITKEAVDKVAMSFGLAFMEGLQMHPQQKKQFFTLVSSALRTGLLAGASLRDKGIDFKSTIMNQMASDKYEVSISNMASYIRENRLDELFQKPSEAEKSAEPSLILTPGGQPANENAKLFLPPGY